MANKVAANLIFIDTTADNIISGDIALIKYAILTPSAADGSVVLHDIAGGSSVPVIEFSGATANDSKAFDFSENPLNLSQGIHAVATNANLTLVRFRPAGRT